LASTAFVVCAVAPGLGWCAGQDDPGLFAPSRLATATGGVIHPTWFAASGVCAGCHTEIVRQWSGSMHARAHPDPIYLALSRQASVATGGLTDRFCAGCHTPVGVVGAEVPPVGNPLMSRSGIEGVGCDFCHVVDRSTGTGNLPAVLDPGSVKRGPRADAVSPFHQTAHLPLATQAEFCGMCHDVSHPINRLPIEQTYTEWKNGPYNTDDPKTRMLCQDCHMRQQPGKPATGLKPAGRSPGKAAAMGPRREHVFSHWFVGGNAASAALLGPTPQADMARERLAAAATMEILSPEAAGGRLRWTVRVHNTGAGHFLPTGLTELRQMWVETEIADASGTIVHRSGNPGPDGELPPGTHLFTTVLGDAGGKPTHRVWEATSVLKDRRIPPLAHDDALFEVPLDGRWKKPLRLAARLRYRSYSPALAVELIGEGAVAPPIIDMAGAEIDYDPRQTAPATPGRED
jgi:hypothetical protein